jgi:hypothetical protein
VIITIVGRSQSGGLVQGLFGLTRITNIETSLSDGAEADEEITLPMIGGAWQTVLSDRRIRFGIEVGLTIGWDSERGEVDLGNDEAPVPSRNRLFGADGFVGVFGDTWLTDELRVYAGVGPLLQYAKMNVEYQDVDNLTRDLEDEGFGGGGYVRGGIEYAIDNYTLVGLGVRQLRSSVDLGGDIDEVDFEGTQIFLSVTQGF